jgi:hypothetical protein
MHAPFLVPIMAIYAFLYLPVTLTVLRVYYLPSMHASLSSANTGYIYMSLHAYNPDCISAILFAVNARLSS